jgi:hypothetical protein
MRQTLLVLAVLLSLTMLARADTTAPEKPFASTSHDFGTVPRGAQLYHRFTWTNHDRVRREITEVRSTCACLTATPGPRVVEPGQQGAIDVLVDARKFVGPKNVTLHIMIGPDRPQAVVLQVSANSRPDVVFNPGEVAFGVMAEGSTATQTIDIEYAGALDWKAEDVLSAGEHLEASLVEEYRRTGQVGYKLKVGLKASAPAGDFKHMLQVKTNDPANQVLSVLVSASIRPGLVIVPDPLYFGGVRVGHQVTRRLTLRADKPFQVLGLDGLDKGLAALAPTMTAAVHSITIHWKPEEAVELNREVTIRTDLERYREVKVKLQGEGSP